MIDQPRGKEIHVIADNLSAHKSRPVTDFLAGHPNVHLHSMRQRNAPIFQERVVLK